MKETIRRLYFNSGLVRALIHTAVWVAKPRNRINSGHLIPMLEEEAYGPVQREEALLLFSVMRVARPKTVVEFGFCGGRSAFNFLQALTPDAKLFSYDIDPGPARLARECFARDDRFTFLHKSQTEFSKEDIGGRTIDFAFIDGAHDFCLNQEAFTKILPALSENAIVAVHDTGTWAKAYFTSFHAAIAAKPENGKWLNSEEYQYKYQADERRFVNWIREAHPEWGALNMGTTRCLRHGISLLQRQIPFKT